MYIKEVYNHLQTSLVWTRVYNINYFIFFYNIETLVFNKLINYPFKKFSVFL